jgi:hypothetical protein
MKTLILVNSRKEPISLNIGKTSKWRTFAIKPTFNMKYAIALMVLFFNLSIFAQSKITFLYEKDLLSPETEGILSGNLKAYNLEYAANIDLNRKCDYFFGNLTSDNNQIFLEIKDCYDVSKGKALVGNRNQIDVPQAYAGAVSFLTNDILVNADKYKTDPTKGTNVAEPENEHASRYFFAPSGYGLKKGELYGATNYFLAYDFQYGLTDNFSLGMGSTIAAFPFYITPKFNFKINEKSHVSVGDMLVLGTWGSKFTANIAYTVYTYGSSNKNVSVGLAYLNMSIPQNDYDNPNLKNKIGQPVINLSGMARLSDYMYIVSENYFTIGKKKDKSDKAYDNNSTYRTFNYSQQSNIAMGALGFRFINKKKDVQSIQFGLAYFINDTKVEYQNGIKPAKNYEILSETQQIFIPTLTFFYKFGKKV